MPPLVFAVVWLGLLVAATRATCLSPVRLLAAVGLVLAGLALWTLFEYLAHRFLFHYNARSTFGKRIIFLAHENHHIDPADPYRNIMPLSVSLVLAALFWLLFHVAFGVAGSGLYLGFILGYVIYDATHYACHQFPMRGRLLARVKRHHLRHHHAGLPANYAITAILWDRIFSTALKTKSRF
ncbi:sterol desaturase family protein [Acidisoma cladoniae]|uniref:sterol desaturase family protein n=1 Tax=Acidisoma cladoniae TaxID=3040935 RepID=UPI00254AD32F|nr:sterol desaturase family protein [Acidisoma sp. PAMC 29798]